MGTKICVKTDSYKISNLIFQMSEGEIQLGSAWKFSWNTFYDFVLSPSNVTSSPTAHSVIRELSIRFILSLAFCKLDSYWPGGHKLIWTGKGVFQTNPIEKEECRSLGKPLNKKNGKKSWHCPLWATPPNRVKSGHLLSDYRQKCVNGTRDILMFKPRKWLFWPQ